MRSISHRVGALAVLEVDDVPEHGHNGFGQTPGFPLILLLFGQSCEETKTPKWTNFYPQLGLV